MSLLEDLKRVAEKTIGWGSSEDPKKRVRQRKPRTYKFKDDGLIPKYPGWPFVIYKGAVRLSDSLDPAAVLEELFEGNDWIDRGGTVFTIGFIITRVPTRFSALRAAQVRCNSAEGRDEKLF